MTGPPARATGIRAALTLTHVAMGALLLLPTWATVSMRSPRLSAQALAAIVLLAAFPTWIVVLGGRVLGRITPGVLRALRWTDAVTLGLGLLFGAGGIWMLEMARQSSERGGGLLGALGLIPLILGALVAALALLSLWLVRTLRRSLAILVGLTLVVAAPPVAAQGRGGNDVQIVQRASLTASGAVVEVFADGVRVDPAFLGIAEAACRKLESLIGRPLDIATLGPKIRIYVSGGVTISHVWRGYQHPSDPKAIVFLNPRVYAGALDGSNATYAHEMAHLFTWRYHSHTLREGLADYLALQIHPGAGVGPNADGLEPRGRIPAGIAVYLGTTTPAPGWLAGDAQQRRAYYLASYRFVKYLVERAGMETFMKLYDSTDPEADIARLYGASRDQLVRMAGM